MTSLDHQTKRCHSCGSMVAASSEDGPTIAGRRMTTTDMTEMLIQIFSQVSGPSSGHSSSDGSFNSIHRLSKVFDAMLNRTLQRLMTTPRVQDLFCSVVGGQVRESIRPILDRSSEAEKAAPSAKTLHFSFLDEVSCPVLTGKEVKSEGDKPIRVAIVDKETGEIVSSGADSSLRAEIVLLDATDDFDEKGFSSRIVEVGDKKKPHFSKAQYVDIKEGVGPLLDIKLGQDRSWTKKDSKCKLGVRLVGNVRGVRVKEAWTKTFTVCDSRAKLYEKGNPPCLFDPLWKLENIGRDGGPIKRLEANNIKTVKDFLFLHSVDPMRLQKIVLGEKRKAKEAKWNAIVKHAKTCRVDGCTDVYVHFPRPESQTGVAFDAVGELKGLVDKSRHYIRFEKLSEDEKAVARELLLSASENPSDVSSFPDEASLMERYSDPRVDEIPSSTTRPVEEDFSVEPYGSTHMAMGFLNDSPGSMRLYEPNLIHSSHSPSHSCGSQNPFEWYDLWEFGAGEPSMARTEGCNEAQLVGVVRLCLLMNRMVTKFKELGSRHHAQKRQRIH